VEVIRPRTPISRRKRSIQCDRGAAGGSIGFFRRLSYAGREGTGYRRRQQGSEKIDGVQRATDAGDEVFAGGQTGGRAEVLRKGWSFILV
jgi:hypothetical protein